MRSLSHPPTRQPPSPTSHLPHGRCDRRRYAESRTRALRSSPDPVARHELLGELVLIHMPLAESLAHRYRSRGIALDDLRQVANLALVKAAHRFDPHAGHAFASYCVPTIRGELQRHFRDHGWMVRPPRQIQELQPRLRQAHDTLGTELGRPPTASELAHRLGVSQEEVEGAQDARGCFTPDSLDAPLTADDDRALIDELGCSDPGFAAAEARVMLSPALARLDARDRRIVHLRYVEMLSQREIGVHLSITQAQVSRTLTRILEELRGSLTRPAARLPGDRAA